jgi:hypothetical protein
MYHIALFMFENSNKLLIPSLINQQLRKITIKRSIIDFDQL